MSISAMTRPSTLAGTKPIYRRLLKPGMRCFDAGMYRGWDALLLAHLTGSEVVSFDGNPKCLELATGFLAPSGSKIRLENAYLTDGTDGKATLDEAAKKYFMPDFIKIDVEGAEAMVLGGAGRILSQHKPSLIVEMHGAAVEAQCVARLHEFGYAPITVDRSRGALTENRGSGHNRWLVCEGRALS